MCAVCQQNVQQSLHVVRNVGVDNCQHGRVHWIKLIVKRLWWPFMLIKLYCFLFALPNSATPVNIWHWHRALVSSHTPTCYRTNSSRLIYKVHNCRCILKCNHYLLAGLGYITIITIRIVYFNTATTIMSLWYTWCTVCIAQVVTYIVHWFNVLCLKNFTVYIYNFSE